MLSVTVLSVPHLAYSRRSVVARSLIFSTQRECLREEVSEVPQGAQTSDGKRPRARRALYLLHLQVQQASHFWL